MRNHIQRILMRYEKNSTKIDKIKIISFIRTTVAITLIILIFSILDINQSLYIIKNCNLLLWACFIGCAISLLLIGSFNEWILLNSIKKVPYKYFLMAYLTGWALGLITPGSAGDSTIIFMMRKYGIYASITSAVYAIDKLITLSLFFFISIYGISYLFSFKNLMLLPNMDYSFIFIIATSIIGIIFFLSFYTKKIRFFYDIKKNLIIILNNKSILLINFIISIFKWIIVTCSFYFAFLSLGANIPIPELAIIPIMSTMVGYLPISIGGIGTVELSATYLFGIIGIKSSLVITTYILMRVTNYLLAFILMLVTQRIKEHYGEKKYH